MHKYAVIVAGGVGTRMKSVIPKQFLQIDGEPIIIKTIRQFLKYDSAINLIVVLPKDQVSHWEELVPNYPFISDIEVALGGATRSQSVQSGLSAIPDQTVDSSLVAIHDAVRPFVPVEVIADSYKTAEKFGSAVAAVKLKDSIRQVSDNGTSTALDRSNFVLVQTPQTFKAQLLKIAYLKFKDQAFSDDAAVFEKAGHKVVLIEGSYENIKITTPEDLK